MRKIAQQRYPEAAQRLFRNLLDDMSVEYKTSVEGSTLDNYVVFLQDYGGTFLRAYESILRDVTDYFEDNFMNPLKDMDGSNLHQEYTGAPPGQRDEADIHDTLNHFPEFKPRSTRSYVPMPQDSVNAPISRDTVNHMNREAKIKRIARK